LQIQTAPDTHTGRDRNVSQPVAAPVVVCNPTYLPGGSVAAPILSGLAAGTPPDIMSLRVGRGSVRRRPQHLGARPSLPRRPQRPAMGEAALAATPAAAERRREGLRRAAHERGSHGGLQQRSVRPARVDATDDLGRPPRAVQPDRQSGEGPDQVPGRRRAQHGIRRRSALGKHCLHDRPGQGRQARRRQGHLQRHTGFYEVAWRSLTASTSNEGDAAWRAYTTRPDAPAK